MFAHVRLSTFALVSRHTERARTEANGPGQTQLLVKMVVRKRRPGLHRRVSSAAGPSIAERDRVSEGHGQTGRPGLEVP